MKDLFSWTWDLFDDETTKEKFKVMNKWDIMCDDERNGPQDILEQMEDFLEFGKKYLIIIEEI